MVDIGLFHDLIGRVPGLDVAVHVELLLGCRIPPNLVVAFALPEKFATVLAQHVFDEAGISGH
jgi:hypothetical protein